MNARAEGSPVPPPIAAFMQAVANHSSGFERDAVREGFDVRCETPVGSLPNRARLKAWIPRPGTFIVFLYKDSNVPFSDDRFSYGALVVKGESPSPDDLRAILDYAATGFHPEHRPLCAKRTIPFTVPR